MKSYLKPYLVFFFNQEAMMMILKGVEKHLRSPIDNVRILGMVVGENLMNGLNRYENLNKTAENKKLKFDVNNSLSKKKELLIVEALIYFVFFFVVFLQYQETEETKLLQSLKIKPQVESAFLRKTKLNEDLTVNFESINLKNELADKPEKVLFTNKSINVRITQNDEDSDDDLLPYDTSNDVPLSTNKQPAYLRDCLDGKPHNKIPSHKLNVFNRLVFSNLKR